MTLCRLYVDPIQRSQGDLRLEPRRSGGQGLALVVPSGFFRRFLGQSWIARCGALASKVLQLPAGSSILLIPSEEAILALHLLSFPVRATGSANGVLQRPCRSPGLNPESCKMGIPENKEVEDEYKNCMADELNMSMSTSVHTRCLILGQKSLRKHGSGRTPENGVSQFSGFQFIRLKFKDEA